MMRVHGQVLDDDSMDRHRRAFRDLVGSNIVTPLIAKLYAMAAREGLQSNSPKLLATSIPTLMLAYVNEINRNQTSKDIEIQRDAKALAWCMVGRSFRAQSCSRNEGLESLRAIFDIDPNGRLDALIHDLRLVRVLGEDRNRIQFVFDPLCEYLAAMHALNKYRADKRSWRAMFQRIDVQADGPISTIGFLRALAESVLDQELEFGFEVTPDFRAFISGEVASRIGQLQDTSDA